MAKFFTEKDVNQLLTMDETIKSLEEAFIASSKKKIINIPRNRIDIEGSNFNFMAASWEEKEIVGYKSYVAGSKGLSFHVCIYSLKDNRLLAIIEANRLGQLRTGAATGIATKFLCQKDSISMGVFGSGFQAETQIEAISNVKKITECIVYSRNLERSQQFCQKMSEKLKIPVNSASDPEQCAVNKDVIVTITNSQEPVLKGKWLSPNTHINAAGSNVANRREIDIEAIERSGLIVVDDMSQAKIECGDLIQYKKIDSTFDWSNVCLLGDLVAKKKKIPENTITLFESQGIALEDIAIAHTLLKKSIKEDRGIYLN